MKTLLNDQTTLQYSFFLFKVHTHTLYRVIGSTTLTYVRSKLVSIHVIKRVSNASHTHTSSLYFDSEWKQQTSQQ